MPSPESASSEFSREPLANDLTILTDRAQAVAASLSSADCAPVVLEFAGSPKSGKSTAIEILHHFFRRMGLKVWAPSEGASKRTPYHLRRDLVAFNTWALNYAISELLVSYLNVDRHHLILLDRGPFDALAWMRLLNDRGQLEAGEYEIIEEFALHRRWRELVSHVYLFTCEPSVSLERETNSKLTVLPGTAMNRETLANLLVQYTALHEQYGDTVPLTVVDTTSYTSARSVAFGITKHVLGLIEGQVRR